jgi:hypothetical protein
VGILVFKRKREKRKVGSQSLKMIRIKIIHKIRRNKLNILLSSSFLTVLT